MDADTLARYRHHTGSAQPPTQAFAEAALVCGRRGGKSRALALIAVFLATMQDVTPHVAPGERATIAVIAADRKQARSIFRFAMGLLSETPMLADLVKDGTADGVVRLKKGGHARREVGDSATGRLRCRRRPARPGRRHRAQHDARRQSGSGGGAGNGCGSGRGWTGNVVRVGVT